jgi:hypothetical protein
VADIDSPEALATSAPVQAGKEKAEAKRFRVGLN